MSVKQQQRELQALRDELRCKWMSEVELETDNRKSMDAAKRLLEEGPRA